MENLPAKYVGETACKNLPVEICGAGCDYQEGAEECHEKVVTSVVEVPEEVCDINPRKICKFVTKQWGLSRDGELWKKYSQKANN